MAAKVINLETVKTRDFQQFKVKHEGFVISGTKAKITVGESVEIWYDGCDHRSGATYHNTFKVGDIAEYGSFNLVYMGPIVSITEKTVSIKTTGDVIKRLDMARFIQINRDFDYAAASKRNSEWTD